MESATTIQKEGARRSSYRNRRIDASCKAMQMSGTRQRQCSRETFDEDARNASMETKATATETEEREAAAAGME